MNITIGYQGMEYSNSMEAAMLLAQRNGFHAPACLPLVTSRGVAEALEDRTVQYGVLAVRNSVAGPVGETEEALEHLSYTVLDEVGVHIHHCLFKRRGDIADSQLLEVASHIQALQQCKGNLETRLPGVQWRELEDTAMGAFQLRDGLLPDTTAALCRLDAGTAAGLHLIAQNVEDFSQNITTFQLIRLEQA